MNAIRFPCCAAARDVRLFDIHVITAASGTTEDVVKVHHRHTSRRRPADGVLHDPVTPPPAGSLFHSLNRRHSLTKPEIQTAVINHCGGKVEFHVDVFAPHSGVRTGAGKIGHADGWLKSFTRQPADDEGGG